MFEEDSPLHQAAYDGDLEEIKRLSGEDDFDIDARNFLGCTALRQAAVKGHVQCVEFLLQHGSDANAVDRKGQTPLLLASLEEHYKCVCCLLDHGANPNGSKNCLTSPVYVVAGSGHLDIMKVLVKYGADVNRPQLIMGSFVSNPLYRAITKKSFECFRCLLAHGAEPNYENERRQKKNLPLCSSLYRACAKMNAELDYVSLLFESGFGLFEPGRYNTLPWDKCDNACATFLKGLSVKPRALLSRCRVVIRGLLEAKCQEKITKLPLPQRIQAYLQFDV